MVKQLGISTNFTLPCADIRYNELISLTSKIKKALIYLKDLIDLPEKL